jgi:hypothetical protein
VLAKLVVAVVVIAPDSRFLEGAVHPLDLSVRPRGVGLVSRCSDPLDRQSRSNIWVRHLAVGPE